MVSEMRIPKLSAIRTAVRIFYENNELRNGDIKELFGCGDSKAAQLKKLAQARVIEEGGMLITRSGVNTDAAYRAWGLDIAALERRMVRAEKLGFHTEKHEAEAEEGAAHGRQKESLPEGEAERESV